MRLLKGGEGANIFLAGEDFTTGLNQPFRPPLKSTTKNVLFKESTIASEVCSASFGAILQRFELNGWFVI